MIEKLKFKKWEDMYKLLISGIDLYNPKTGCYVFKYNDTGALCYYTLSPDEAFSIIEQSKKNCEYWGAYLGTGGYVLDDMKYRNGFKKYLQPSFGLKMFYLLQLILFLHIAKAFSYLFHHILL